VSTRTSRSTHQRQGALEHPVVDARIRSLAELNPAEQPSDAPTVGRPVQAARLSPPEANRLRLDTLRFWAVEDASAFHAPSTSAPPSFDAPKHQRSSSDWISSRPSA